MSKQQSQSLGKDQKLAPFDYTVSIIGGKWKMLSTQRSELEKNGIVNRVEYPQIPPKVEYSLTPKGKTLMPILEQKCKWGVHNQEKCKK
ncbi:winged helix-turn-helix transcriptional regulator [Brevibacillus sp. NRS-1366]|uniref:winged helix-turn-helix transcriptional regulator n=1 Tax=Brevibacillus sp. NRS-1366 TaxID=3233899 RepID=UPI003D2638C8